MFAEGKRRPSPEVDRGVRERIRKRNAGTVMPLTKERKQQLAGEFGRGKSDTGSPEVQVSLLTNRISQMTDHLQVAFQGLRQPAWFVGDGQPATPAVGLREADEPAVVSRSVAASGDSQVSVAGVKVQRDVVRLPRCCRCCRLSCSRRSPSLDFAWLMRRGSAVAAPQLVCRRWQAAC